MHIHELQDLAHDQSESKGFWGIVEDLYRYADETDIPNDKADDLLKAIIGQKLALIHSEVTEALEDMRDGKPFTGPDALEYGPDGKPEGFASELADIVIRVLDLAGGLGIELGYVMETKLRYNAEKRGKLHGKGF